MSGIAKFKAGKAAPLGLRPDGTKKDRGYLGPLKVPGGVATEYSAQSDAVKINGERVDFPTLVPTLSKSEIEQMVGDIIPNRKEIPEPIMQKAIRHAKQRIESGKSPFFKDPPRVKGQLK